jgi:hypothetical protein
MLGMGQEGYRVLYLPTVVVLDEVDKVVKRWYEAMVSWRRQE